jgi:NADPH2:quinone reductase
MPLPFILGYDFSGIVEEVGNGVAGFAVGDAVFAVNWGKGKHNTEDASLIVGGAFAEFISVPASILSHKPENVSHETAAAVALVGTTALDGLNTAKVTAGSRVLILGASTSVGLIAIQEAKLRGIFQMITIFCVIS